MELEENIKCNAAVTESIWDEDSGKWKLKIIHQEEVIEDECDILVNGSGFLK